jgi:hypothetical protein
VDEAQLPAAQTFTHELLEPRLDDRHVTLGEGVDLGVVDVATDDRVPELGQAGSGGQADVTGADDGNVAHAHGG